MRPVLLSLMLLLAVTNAAVCAETAPGGHGTIKSASTTCFQADSDRVATVCGNYQIGWQLSSLMGDPLGSSGLRWTAESVQLRRGRKEAPSNRVAIKNLPDPLRAAALRSELSIDAVVYFVANNTSHSADKFGALWFNTGVGVRPGGELSFNVPAGFSWDKFLVGAGAAKFACDEKARKYMSPAAAKDMMIRGVSIDAVGGAYICPSTSVSADDLSDAVDMYCQDEQKAKGTSWCEQKANKKKFEEENASSETKAVDDAFSKLDGGPPTSSGRDSRKKSSTKDSAKAEADPFAKLDNGRAKPSGLDSLDKPNSQGPMGFDDAIAAAVKQGNETKRINEEAKLDAALERAKQAQGSSGGRGDNFPVLTRTVIH